ncbi:MAG: response regulator [Candidatus Thermoplasmatota archaeon]
MSEIMIVDDEPDQIFTVEQILKSYKDDSYKVVGAQSGRECLKKLQEGVKPDIILLDIMMPEMSGWEVFDKIRDNTEWSDIPIVFLTARTDDIAEEAGDFLADDYIEKPFEIEQLINRIDKLLDKKQ